MEVKILLLLTCLISCAFLEVDGKNPHKDCLLPKEVGPCDALFPRYYYNIETEQCDKFYYGGCDGNANNFEILEDCKKRCKT